MKTFFSMIRKTAMSLRDIEIKHSYISCGDDNLYSALVEPSLHTAISYKRSVGYFSSSVFDVVADGIVALVRNGGKIQLICGPELSKDDKEAIECGYKVKEKVAEEQFSSSFSEEIDMLSDDRLVLLADLIAKGKLEIKIALMENPYGIYHDKLGLIEDEEGNTVVFYGSPN